MNVLRGQNRLVLGGSLHWIFHTYTKFDKKNNWTERKVSYATEYDDYDDDMNYIGKKQTWPEEYIEKRAIEYW